MLGRHLLELQRTPQSKHDCSASSNIQTKIIQQMMIWCITIGFYIHIIIFITTLFIFLIVVMFVHCIVALIRQTVRSMRSGWTVNFWQFSDGTSMLRIELRLVNSTTSLTLDHVSASLCTNFASEKLPERKILQFEYFSVVCIYCATVQFRISYNKFFNSFPILTNCKIYKILFTLYTKDPKISYNDIYIENRL